MDTVYFEQDKGHHFHQLKEFYFAPEYNWFHEGVIKVV
jgi:hypothetical protein